MKQLPSDNTVCGGTSCLAERVGAKGVTGEMVKCMGPACAVSVSKHKDFEL